MSASVGGFKYGFSSADRYIKCHASPRLSVGAVVNRTDKKDEGKAVHAVAEQCLNMGFDPADFIGRELFDVKITDDMTDSAELYVNYVRQQSGVKHYELELGITSLSQTLLRGTADCVIIDGDLLHIIDFKNGRSEVDVRGNWQLIGYAIAALDTLNLHKVIKRVKLTIVQPNYDHADGVIRSDERRVSDVLWLGMNFKAAIENTDGKAVAGKHCKYCPAAGYCGERLRHTMSLVGLDNSVSKLNAQQIMAVLHEASTIRATLAAIEEQAVNHVRNGYPLTDFKLVKSRVIAKCSNESGFLEEAVAAGADIADITKTKVIGATACKKVVDAELVNKYFVKPEAGTQLVKMTDKRTAIAADASGVFDKVK